MTTVVEVVFLVFLLVMLALVAVVAWAAWRFRESDRARVLRQARLDEQRIADIGLRAQAAILEEALKRAQEKPRSNHGQTSQAHGGYGPWPD